MSATIKAAVLHEVNGDVQTREVTLRDPGPNEVQVAIRASGICHSDVSAIDGTVPQPLPAVLGHEGAGEILAVGEDVDGLSVGDHIIVCWTPACGECPFCARGEDYLCLMGTMAALGTPSFFLDDEPLYGMSGTGTFAERVNLPPAAVVKVDEDVPFEFAALIGCGVMTGVGAAVNAAPVTPEASVAVIGAGGVGVSVIQGARIQQAGSIVAIDQNEEKFDVAREFGATETVLPGEIEDVKQRLTQGEGFDFVFDVVGSPATLRSAFDMTRRGGTMCVVGVGRQDVEVSFNPFELFFMNRTITSTVYGNSRPAVDFPRLVTWWREGKLDLERMVGARVALDDVGDTIKEIGSGRAVRHLVTL